MVSALVESGYRIGCILKYLNISRSSYYRIKKGVKKTKVEAYYSKELEVIKAIKDEHVFWGYRRVWAYLNYELKIKVSKCKVYSIMKKHDLLVTQKRYKAKRKADNTHKPKATKKNQFWGIDMTKFYVNGCGWIYVTFVLDWFTKKIVGYHYGLQSKSTHWLQALETALINECPNGAREYGLNLISDNGSQCTSSAFENRLKTLDIKHITTSYSNPKGNADTERLMRTFKEEAVWPYEFDTFNNAESKISRFVDFYNYKYPHSKLNYLSPVNFEIALSENYVAA